MTLPTTPTREEGREHTPTPWFIDRDPRPGMHWNMQIACKKNPNIQICSMFHDNTKANKIGKANAALIVEAVNAHSTLTKETARLAERVRVLEGALDKVCKACAASDIGFLGVYDIARSALSQKDGE